MYQLHILKAKVTNSAVSSYHHSQRTSPSRLTSPPSRSSHLNNSIPPRPSSISRPLSSSTSRPRPSTTSPRPHRRISTSPSTSPRGSASRTTSGPRTPWRRRSTTMSPSVRGSRRLSRRKELRQVRACFVYSFNLKSSFCPLL